MVLKQTIVAAAAALLCASAHALYVEDGEGPDPFNGGGGGIIIAGTPGVSVTGIRQVTIDVGVFIDVQRTTLIPDPPYASDTTGRYDARTPAEKQKAHDDCTNACSLAYQIANASCIDAIAQLRYEISARPYWAAFGGFISGAIATRNGLGAIIGAATIWKYQSEVNESLVTNTKAQCDGAAAAEFVSCASYKCNYAGLLALALLRRRRPEEPNAA